MNPDAKGPEMDLSRDLNTFEKLPARTKELTLIKDDTENATGEERVALDLKLQVKAAEAPPPTSTKNAPEA